MSPPDVLPHNLVMTFTPQATFIAPVPVFEVDAGGALGRALGTGSQFADDVVLVEGPLTETLATAAPAALRVALPPDGPTGEPTLVDVETVHVPDPEVLAELHGRDGAASGTVMVALELVRPAASPTLDRVADVPEPDVRLLDGESGPDVDPFDSESGPDVEPDPDPPPPEDSDVICLLFPGLRICRD